MERRSFLRRLMGALAALPLSRSLKSESPTPQPAPTKSSASASPTPERVPIAHYNVPTTDETDWGTCLRDLPPLTDEEKVEVERLMIAEREAEEKMARIREIWKNAPPSQHALGPVIHMADLEPHHLVESREMPEPLYFPPLPPGVTMNQAYDEIEMPSAYNLWVKGPPE